MMDVPGPLEIAGLVSRLSHAEVEVSEFGENYFVEARLDDLYVVIEARPVDSEYGVTEDPGLFAGSEAVYSDPWEAALAAAMLLDPARHERSQADGVSPEDVRHHFPRIAASTDPAALSVWARQPSLTPPAAA